MEFRPGILPGEPVRYRRLRNPVWSQNIWLGREVGSKRGSGMLLAYERPLCAMSGRSMARNARTGWARLRDFSEAPGAPRQIQSGTDSRAQIADQQSPKPTFTGSGRLTSSRRLWAART
jgi:hypothetical protein